MAQSPAVLEGYLNLSGSLSKGELPIKLREQIALLVSERNGSSYCICAHSAIGQIAGMCNEEILDSRQGVSCEKKFGVALDFVKKLVKEHGHLTDNDLAQVREAKFSDGEITEIIANVALNLWTNYFNLVAEPKMDFPAVQSINGGHEELYNE